VLFHDGGLKGWDRPFVRCPLLAASTALSWSCSTHYYFLLLVAGGVGT
jgi:hypothetical protein